MSALISDLLHPRTDQAVFIQLGVIVSAWLVSAWFARRNRDVLHFVTGLALIALAWRGLSATH